MRFGREKNEGKGEERRLWRGEWGEEMGDRRWGREEYRVRNYFLIV